MTNLGPCPARSPRPRIIRAPRRSFPASSRRAERPRLPAAALAASAFVHLGAFAMCLAVGSGRPRPAASDYMVEVAYLGVEEAAPAPPPAAPDTPQPAMQAAHPSPEPPPPPETMPHDPPPVEAMAFPPPVAVPAATATASAARVESPAAPASAPSAPALPEAFAGPAQDDAAPAAALAAEYWADVRARIAASVRHPGGLSADCLVRATMRLGADGRVEDLRVSSEPSDTRLMRAVERAIRRVAPFPAPGAACEAILPIRFAARAQ